MRPVIVSILTGWIFIALTGCGGQASPTAKRSNHPRIVSYAPSLTQILFDMGLGKNVVGVTRWCILPKGVSKPIVGDRLQVSTEAILNVKPDIVLIQQNPEDFGALKKVKPDVKIYHFAINTLEDIASAIERIGRIVGKDELGRRCRREFENKLKRVKRAVAGLKKVRVVFLDGYERPMVHGKGTFIGEMIELAGGINAAAEKYDGWAMVSDETVIALRPDVLICLVNPSQSVRARRHWSALADMPAVRNDRVIILTDRRWSIPSTLSADFARQLAGMIHSGLSSDSRDGKERRHWTTTKITSRARSSR